MKVKRIVSNIEASKISAAKRFYGDVLGLDVLMEMSWITTYGSRSKMPLQVSIMSEGGSGTEVPDLSIEVDDVAEAFNRMKKAVLKSSILLQTNPGAFAGFMSAIQPGN